MKLILTLSLFMFVHSVSAEQIKIKIISAVKTRTSDLGIGSKVELEFVEKNEKKEVLFLGQMTGHPDFGTEILFLDEKETRVHMIDAETMPSKFLASKLHNIVSPIDQAGETCAAYALFHYWLQTSTAGFVGNGELGPVMSKERSRMKFLEESITSYYLGRSTELKPVMKKFGDRFGFKCKQKVFEDANKAIDYVYSQAEQGMPIMMEFFIGPDMYTSEFELSDYESDIEMDARLWIPRKIGERNSGGHVIVAAGAFTTLGQKKLMVLDSDWAEPRVWDLGKFLGGKTAIKEMIFHACE